ncbi:MAG: hypothetical protein JNM50_07575 [Chromatiales bacterium]|nr:hypothetical protein [Chromatiales bacterium]
MRGADLQTAALSLRAARAAATLALALLFGVLAPGEGAAADAAAFEQAMQGQSPAATIAAGRRWLKDARYDAAVTTVEQRRVYAVMLGAAPNASSLRDGNRLAAELVASESRALGADSVDRVPGLYLAADWYDYAGRYRDARRLLEQAVVLIEAAHGPGDAQLALPLRRIAEECLRDRRDADIAHRAIDRAMALTLGTTRDDTRERAEAFAVRGDWEVVFGLPPAGASWYRAAWQRLADSTWFGRSAADEAFGQPVPIVVDIPDKPFASLRRDPDFFAAGVVAFGFTVTPEGTLEDIVLRRNLSPTGSVPDPLEKALRQARYRPRIQGGMPVATPDHGYEVRFERDPRLRPRKASVGPIDQRY